MKTRALTIRLAIWIVAAAMITPAIAQRSSLDLNEAYALLEEQYPALKNTEILEQLYERKLETIDKGRLPEFYLKGDSRLQSENLTIEGEPGAPVPFEFSLPLWSAKGYVEIQYNVLNGKVNDTRQSIESFDLQKDLQAVEVDRYALQARVNDLFTNVLLFRERIKLIELSISDLETRLEVVQAAIDNGVALPSEADRIRVHILELMSSRNDIQERINGMLGTLEHMTGAELAQDVQLTIQDLGPADDLPELSRPEQKLFALQRESLLARADLIELERRPYLGLFAQGGAGYPNPVNFFDTGFAPFGIVGVNFTWKITDWNKAQVDKELLRLQANQISSAEETFEFNLNTQEQTYLAEIRRLQNLIETETAIAKLQSDILEQMSAQLDEGIITSSDYLLQSRAELKANQSVAIHKIQLIQTQLEFWNARGRL